MDPLQQALNETDIDPKTIPTSLPNLVSKRNSTLEGFNTKSTHETYKAVNPLNLKLAGPVKAKTNRNLKLNHMQSEAFTGSSPRLEGAFTSRKRQSMAVVTGNEPDSPYRKESTLKLPRLSGNRLAKPTKIVDRESSPLNSDFDGPKTTRAAKPKLNPQGPVF